MKKLVALLLLVSNAGAASASEAAEAYHQGRFLVARDLGRSLGDPESLTWACRAGLVIGGYGSDADTAARDLRGAIEDCNEALKGNPDDVITRVSHAMALGFEGKRVKKASHVKAARAELEATLAAYPDNPIVLGALGGWHAAVSRSGFLARTVLGGSAREARDYFTRALRIDPDNVPLRFEFLKFLATGDRKERAEALEGLIAFEAMKPSDAFDRMLIERSRALTDALRIDDKKAIREARLHASAFARITEAKDTLEPYPLDAPD